MKFKVGDNVAYSVQWLRSIGESHGDLARARGKVTDLRPLGKRTLVTIDWNDDRIPPKVIDANLAKVGANTRFCRC